MTKFQSSVTGMAGSALRAAGSLFGRLLGQASNSAYEIERAIQGPAHDHAFRAAVEEAKHQLSAMPQVHALGLHQFLLEPKALALL